METTSSNAPASTRDHTRPAPDGDPGSTPAPKPGVPAPTTDEAAYLAQQAADAQAAFAQTLQAMAAQLGKGFDPRKWTQQYPWISLGATAVLGFFATATLVPSKEEQALKKLASIERALQPPAVPTQQASGAPAAAKPRDSSIMRTILGELTKVLQPVLVSLLAANASSQAAKAEVKEAHVDAKREQAGEATAETAAS